MPGCREKGNHEPSFHHARILLKCELPLSDFPQKTPLKNAVLVLSEVRGTGTAKFFSAEKSRFCPSEGQESRSETEVLRMQENSETTRDRQLDEEPADVLIAISVIAKRLARKLQTANQEGGTPDGENERPGLTD